MWLSLRLQCQYVEIILNTLYLEAGERGKMNIVKDKVIYSPLPPRPSPPDQPYIERLLAEVSQEIEETGDRDWIVDTETGQSHTISKIEPVSRRVAGALNNLGFGPGDVLQTGYSSCLDFYWPAFGAWLCGGAVSLADPNLSSAAIKQQIKDTKAKIIVCSKQYLDKYCAIKQELREEDVHFNLSVLDEEDGNLPADVKSFQSFLNFDGDISHNEKLEYIPDSVTMVLWSSGSTGNPKGILHSHRTLQTITLAKPSSPKSILVSAIMFHIGGFTLNLSIALFGGTTSYFIKEKCFSGENWFKIAEKFQPEHVYIGVSQFIQVSKAKNVDRNLSGVKMITPLGGAVSPECCEKVLSMVGDQAKIIEMYGSTEIVFLAFKLNKHPKFGFLGTLGSGAEMYIQDIKTGEKLGPRKEGKMMVRTRSMMMNYLNREEENREFFNSDGFGYVGDVGYYDEEGNIFFCYRMREVLKVDNYWFGPEEVENLLEALDDINEACVWGEYDINTGNDQVTYLNSKREREFPSNK